MNMYDWLQLLSSVMLGAVLYLVGVKALSSWSVDSDPDDIRSCMCHKGSWVGAPKPICHGFTPDYTEPQYCLNCGHLMECHY